MVFSNLVFLFIFLPIVLAIYYISPRKLKNIILLLASLIFYAWGEPTYVFLMLLSIAINYVFGLMVADKTKNPKRKKVILIVSIIANLLILGYFKYVNFFIDLINDIFATAIVYQDLPLPIGISFFTFQAMSYVIDVYRDDAKAQRNLFDLALYIALFPQLVAGPIVRYTTVAEQLKSRVHNMDLFVKGVQQFILGLSKKVLIANPMGEIADTIFATPTSEMSVATVWLGIIAYSLQIYFDFSGYSDMAIGLGKMFGFEFLKNFNYPYISRSVSDFWRRWHISLSSWFRDYIYIPLGGNRGGTFKTYRNILIVWTVTGFWHGASWTFMAWGFYYGVLIALERAGLLKWINKLPRPIQHMYVLIIVMIGWVFFRADNFTYSFDFIQAMFGIGVASVFDNTASLILNDNGYLFILAFIFAMPVYPWVMEKVNAAQVRLNSTAFTFTRNLVEPIVLMVLLVIITVYLVNSTYNPFIYFRF